VTDDMLEIRSLDVAYGDFQALFGIDILVRSAETVSIIGANGAGKSTLLKAIAGLVPARSGTITYAGEPLSLSAPSRVERGISLVPEGRRIFPSLSVEENIAVGAYAKREGPWNKQRVVSAFPLLKPLLKRNSAALSGGEQQALAIARALMANPDLLLLDEVSLGLAPVVVKQVYQAIPAIKEQGTTVLLVEQDVNQALAVADRFYCLLEGRVSLAGLPADVTKEQVTDGYFGLEANGRSGP
jgi:branched-chain amino acid transport system ATP-binding protein